MGAEDVTSLRGWLDGRDVPEGLVVDSGLRWPILCAVAAAGAVGEEDIAAEAERDVAVDAREHPLRTRASLPNTAAKQRAWELLQDVGLPTTDQRAILRNGFWQPGQEELTAPYTPKFLTLIEQLRESGRRDRAFEFPSRPGT